MPATVVTVTGTITDSSETPVPAGILTFQISALAQVPGADLLIAPSPVRCTTNPLGQIVGPQNQTGCPLIANDTSSISPAGTDYILTVTLPGGGVTMWSFTLESSMTPTIDLSELTLTPYPS